MFEANIEKGILTIRIPLQKTPQPSKSSGKSLILASTGGHFPTGCEVNGKQVKVSVIASIPAQ